MPPVAFPKVRTCQIYRIFYNSAQRIEVNWPNNRLTNRTENKNKEIDNEIELLCNYYELKRCHILEFNWWFWAKIKQFIEGFPVIDVSDLLSSRSLRRMIVGFSKNRRIYSSLVRVRLWSLKHSTIFIIITIVSHIGTDLDQYGVFVRVCVCLKITKYLFCRANCLRILRWHVIWMSQCVFSDEFAIGLLEEK